MSAGYCDRHIGDAHRPRCGACDVLDAEYRSMGMSRCRFHPAHFRPCEKGCDG